MRRGSISLWRLEATTDNLGFVPNFTHCQCIKKVFVFPAEEASEN